MELEQRREFLRNYDKLVDMFGQELVDQGLARYTDGQLTETKDFPLEDSNGRSLNPGKPYGPHIYVGRTYTHHRFVNSQGWEKSVLVPVERYTVANQYQHNYQAQHIVKPAMLEMYPWLSEFELSIFSIDFCESGVKEFYVKLSETYSGHKSLYVPYKAFMEGDVEAIVKRNEEYLKWYTKSDALWNAMRDALWNAMRDALWNAMREDPVIDAFLSKVKENKK
jgi:hypothetical protein